MGLVTTMGKYCFIQCDGPACTKKIEHIDPEQVKQLVMLCGWEREGDQWMCPACVEAHYGSIPPRKGRSKSLSPAEPH
jgi:hypothetical protein